MQALENRGIFHALSIILAETLQKIFECIATPIDLEPIALE